MRMTPCLNTFAIWSLFITYLWDHDKKSSRKIHLAKEQRFTVSSHILSFYLRPGRGDTSCSLIYMYACLFFSLWVTPNENDTDLKFGIHTSLDHTKNNFFLFSKKWPGAASTWIFRISPRLPCHFRTDFNI